MHMADELSRVYTMGKGKTKEGGSGMAMGKPPMLGEDFPVLTLLGHQFSFQYCLTYACSVRKPDELTGSQGKACGIALFFLIRNL